MRCRRAGNRQRGADRELVRVLEHGAVRPEQLRPPRGVAELAIGDGRKGVTTVHLDGPLVVGALVDGALVVGPLGGNLRDGQPPTGLQPIRPAGEDMGISPCDLAPLHPIAVVALGEAPQVVARLHPVADAGIGRLPLGPLRRRWPRLRRPGCGRWVGDRIGRRLTLGGGGERRGAGRRAARSGSWLCGLGSRGRRCRDERDHRDQQHRGGPLRTAEARQLDPRPVSARQVDRLDHDGEREHDPGGPTGDGQQAREQAAVVRLEQGTDCGGEGPGVRPDR